MTFKNIAYFNGSALLYGDVTVENGVITDATVHGTHIPAGTDYLIPGLVDVHLHGNSGHDFSDGDAHGNAAMLRFLAQNGTLTCCPTTMALPEDVLADACHAIIGTQPADGARVAGIHLEGPFFHPAKKGAQPECNLKHPDAAMILRLQEVAQGAVRILSFAPELPGSGEMIATLKDQMVLSAAHTTADYDTAAAAICAGVTHVTHLFNAMPPLLHRDPGLIGAAAEAPQVNAELICDGIHVHPAMVRAAFSLFGADRICLISDAMSACGMPNGNYSLGGQAVQVTDGRATLADGTLAGSASTLFFCLQQAIRFGIPAADAVKAATLNPARVLGLDTEIGRVAPGYRADLLLCDSDWNLTQVYLQGEALKA